MCACVYTQSEISEIVKRRTAYETALIRKGSNANDWLAYIEYEKKLERLRRLRCSRMSEPSAFSMYVPVLTCADPCLSFSWGRIQS